MGAKPQTAPRYYDQNITQSQHRNYMIEVNGISCFITVCVHACIKIAMAFQITSLTIVYSTVYQGTDQRKHQSSSSLAFVRGIPRLSENSPQKGPVTRKMFPFDDTLQYATAITQAIFQCAHKQACLPGGHKWNYLPGAISVMKSLQTIWISVIQSWNGCRSSNEVAVSSQKWEGTSLVAPVMTAKRHAL